jgi:stearoyl-CoA desaturase (delta-9 desaturase)
VTWPRVLRNAFSVSPVVLSHLALVAVPFLAFSPWSLAVIAGFVFVAGHGVTVGFHRCLAHRSFKTSRVFQFLLAAAGCLALQKGPLWWVVQHRLHHRHADREGDPHSPVQRGFWYAHLGWMFSRDLMDPDRGVVKDLNEHPELVWLDRLWMLPGLLFAVGCYLALGWGGVVVGYCLPLALMYQVTFAINSVCHLFGTRRFETGEESRNNWLFALLANGEGWHNNHHRASYSARHGFAWYELDTSYQLIRLFAWLRLAWDVKLPPPGLLPGGDIPPGPATAPSNDSSERLDPADISNGV